MPHHYSLIIIFFLQYGQQGDQTSQSKRESVLNIHWKDWCWNWNSNTLATWCEELTHWKRPWCWERLGAGGRGEDRGWDGWMASSTRWTWVWAGSRRRWGSGSLACCGPRGHRELDRTWWLSSNNSLVHSQVPTKTPVTSPIPCCSEHLSLNFSCFSW